MAAIHVSCEELAKGRIVMVKMLFENFCLQIFSVHFEPGVATKVFRTRLGLITNVMVKPHA
eukprot:10982476-Lingulodinium_polyedra.AAC.1